VPRTKAGFKQLSQIQEACKLLDINLLDHLIIAPEKEYYSFADEGLL
jgi:DNA repair protein RadC